MEKLQELVSKVKLEVEMFVFLSYNFFQKESANSPDAQRYR